MTTFTDLVDLAAERLGGAALLANDDFFAPKESLVKAAKPVFLEHEYTDRGKWMDGWETRRRRTPGYDWCIVRLGLPGAIRGVVIDTAFFRGNYPEHASLEAACVDGDPKADALASDATRWHEILPKSALRGDSPNLFEIAAPWRFTHVRLNIFPDGGVARLRVHGDVVAHPERLAGEPDLAALENGARVLLCSDMFFGSRHNLILPGASTHMGDGWETKRRRGPGHDWALVELATSGEPRRVVVDTSHFKGNAPGSCSIEACHARGASAEQLERTPWRELLPQTPLRPHAVHEFAKELRSVGPVTHLRLNVFPDGGVARLRAFGAADADGRAAVGLRRLDTLLPERAEEELLRCGGSLAWARALAAKRPFGNVDALHAAADGGFGALGREGWLEAFASHPRIGATSGSAWSREEQKGASRASADVRAALVAANADYERRFGHVFIVCATGKSADEMLALLRARLPNDPGRELEIAAAEQRKIARLRLDKLLAG